MDELSFDWDAANREHVARHDVTPQEAEEVILGEPLDMELQVEESSEEARILVLGETAAGRILQLVVTHRGNNIRVISGWDAPRQLKLYFLSEMSRRYGQDEDS